MVAYHPGSNGRTPCRRATVLPVLFLVVQLASCQPISALVMAPIHDVHTGRRPDNVREEYLQNSSSAVLADKPAAAAGRSLLAAPPSQALWAKSAQGYAEDYFDRYDRFRHYVSHPVTHDPPGSSFSGSACNLPCMRHAADIMAALEDNKSRRCGSF